MILQTPRLRLRPLEDADLDALCAITADPQVMAFVGDGLVLGRAATAQWITNAGASVRLGGIGSRAITLREDGRLIGWAGLIPTSEEHRLELIYGLARAYWGQGYAAEAAQAILTTTEGSVDATIDPENGASRHILTGLGFAVVGMETDENGLETLRLRRP